ncbi:MAG: Uma2 family endonuclease [Anaerolineae bacterium]
MTRRKSARLRVGQRLNPYPAHYKPAFAFSDDGRRYEIVEGVLYVVNASSFEHQFIVTQLIIQPGNFVQREDLGLILTAPFEVHLSETTRPVQPDIVFIRAGKRPGMNTPAFKGVPDLLVEVLSPSSVRTDRHIKFDA